MALIETIRPFGPNSKAVDIDVMGPNPLVDYIRRAYDSSPYSGDPPTMFFSGDRPPFIATGEDPGLLRKIRYELRHTAAMTESRSLLFQCIEASAGALTVDPETLMSPEGE